MRTFQTPSRGCLRRVDVDDQGLLRRSQNGKVSAETFPYSPAQTASGDLLGLFKHPLGVAFGRASPTISRRRYGRQGDQGRGNLELAIGVVHGLFDLTPG
jgi:hypothetical protein